jgi:ribosome-binding factor A
MAQRRPSRKNILQACSDIGPGDGDDPRFDRPDPDQGPGGRKTLQLCGQVARTLAQVLPGLGDPVLRDLLVSSVVPARGKGRVLITLAPSPSAQPVALDVLAEHVARAAILLRQEVASAIHRRKVPELVFRVEAG